MDETSTPPGDPHPTSSGPRVTRDEMTDVRRLRRPHERMVGGVAAGVARHFDVDPLVVRVAFVVLIFFGGAGLVLYGALWLLLPEDGAEQATVPLDERSRGVALVGVVVVAALALLGDTAGLYWFPWPLILVGLVAWFFWDRSQKQAQRRQTQQGQTYPSPAYGPQTYSGQAQAGQTYAHEPYAPEPYAPQPPATQPHSTQQGPAFAPAPPTRPLPPPTVRPRDPRRRGPILFGVTLALVALAIGVLGTVDLAGVDVVDSAYPATALAVVSVMLLVGAFWGRAGGLILLALVAATATAGTMAAEGYEHDRVVHAPVVAADLDDRYDKRRGELVIDLRDVRDLEELDGRRVSADLGVGRLEVIVPAGLSVDVEADVGVGSLRFNRGDDGPGVDVGGLGISRSHSFETRRAPRLQLDLDLGVGEIVVRRDATDPNGTTDPPDRNDGNDLNDLTEEEQR